MRHQEVLGGAKRALAPRLLRVGLLELAQPGQIWAGLPVGAGPGSAGIAPAEVDGRVLQLQVQVVVVAPRPRCRLAGAKVLSPALLLLLFVGETAATAAAGSSVP